MTSRLSVLERSARDITPKWACYYFPPSYRDQAEWMVQVTLVGSVDRETWYPVTKTVIHWVDHNVVCFQGVRVFDRPSQLCDAVAALLDDVQAWWARRDAETIELLGELADELDGWETGQ